MNNGHGRVLVADDEAVFCELISRILQKEGYVPLLAHDGKTAMQKVRSELPDAVLIDLVLPDVEGMELMRRVKALDEDLPVVIITGHAGIPGAVEAMRAGAHDYLAKPFRDDELVRVVGRALAERQLKLKLRQLSRQILANQELTEIMGPSEAIGQLIAEVKCVAKSNFSVVLIGETGAGKEVVARAVHQASPRAKGPFIPVDCGAIPETLLEGELFGYERGAFTGAVGSKRGKFELAQGGTLFLDEILNLPLASQAKLLRAIQERTIYRLGSTSPVRVDVRVLVAASQDLQAAVAPGSFRMDLFYRLNEFTLKIPALRERKEDIPYLAKRFLDLTNTELNKAVRGFSEGAVNALLSYKGTKNPAMKTRRGRNEDKPPGESMLNLGGLFSGLSDLVGKLGELAETGKRLSVTSIWKPSTLADQNRMRSLPEALTLKTGRAAAGKTDKMASELITVPAALLTTTL